jgi:serine/threonine-protein kinase
VLLKGLKGPLVPSSFEGDGQHLLAMLKGEIVRVTVVDGTVQRVHETRDHEAWPELSPDGRWLAYGSNKSGRNEIYVRPYPGEGGAEPVSIDGGFSPAWNANGRELFFVSLAVAPWKHRMMAVDFAPGPPLRIGRPHVMFEFDSRSLSLGCVPVRCYDVAPDGQQFYAVEQRAPLPPASVTHIDLIENWFEELKAKVPVRR